MPRALLLLAACTVAACAHAAEPAPAEPALGGSAGERVARAAQDRLERGGPLVRRDCSGFVATVLGDVGVRRRGGTRHFWQRARRDGRVHDGTPRPGDLAFFDNTYDANRNGRVDDELTHIAVVVGVERDGRIRLVHFGSRRIKVLWVTPRRPALHRSEGKVLNSFLRSSRYGPKDGQRLAGELLRGFARPPAKPAGDAPGAPSSSLVRGQPP